MAWGRDQIVSVNDLPIREVPVPVWGDGATVFLRTMTAADRDLCFMLARKGDSQDVDPYNFRARLLVFCICDEFGVRLFRNDEVDLLGAKCGAAIGHLFAEAQKLN